MHKPYIIWIYLISFMKQRTEVLYLHLRVSAFIKKFVSCLR
jgi:hypothetical protein